MFLQHGSSIHQLLAKVAIFYHQNLDMTLDAAARSSLTTHPGDWAPFFDVVALLSTELFFFSNDVCISVYVPVHECLTCVLSAMMMMMMMMMMIISFRLPSSLFLLCRVRHGLWIHNTQSDALTLKRWD